MLMQQGFYSVGGGMRGSSFFLRSKQKLKEEEETKGFVND